MAKIAVLGSVARDDVVRLDERLREGCHLQGRPPIPRLGGGGANSAIALAHAGHQASLVAAVGDDSLATDLLDELARHGVDIGPVTRISGPSTRSLVLLDPSGERTIVNLTRAEETRPPRRLLDLEADCVYVRSRRDDLGEILREKSRLCPVIAQIQACGAGQLPARILIGSYADLDEATRTDPLAAGRWLAGDMLEWVIVTRGHEGAQAFATDGRLLCATAPDVPVVDTTGAGDAFAAGLAHALALGMDMSRALPEAVRWGAAKVGQPGSFLDGGTLRGLLGAPHR